MTDAFSSSSLRLAIFGCGYVGTAVAREARALGWRVTALTRNTARADALRALGAEVVSADLASDAWHEQVPRDQDFVVNCVSSGGGGLPGYWRSYVTGTESILRWAGDGVPATFLYTSSTSVYGQGGGEHVTEDSPTGGGSEASEPLLAAERLVRESSAFRRTFILRLVGIYGPGRHYLVDQLRSGATVFPGTGAHRLNLIHLDDITAAIFACLKSEATIPGGVFNVADDAPAPKGEVAAWLAGRLNLPTPAFAHDTDRPAPLRSAQRASPAADSKTAATKAASVSGSLVEPREMADSPLRSAQRASPAADSKTAATKAASVSGSLVEPREMADSPLRSAQRASPANAPGAIARDVPDRFISNARLKEVIGWKLRHPDYKSGYDAIFAASSAG